LLFLERFVVASRFWPIVVWVEARIVSRPVNLNPLGAVNTPAVLSGRTGRESARHLNPSGLLHGNGLHLSGRLRQVLVLAEDERHIVAVLSRHSHHVEGQTHINTLFFANENRRGAATGKTHGLVAISERAGESSDAPRSHNGQLGRPEMIPKRVVGWVGDPRIKESLCKDPAPASSDALGKGLRIVIWEAITEGFLSSVKEILAVYEGNGAFRGRFRRHVQCP
jgi:hypothetical protein